MSQLKLIAAVTCFSLLMIGTASADPWGRYHRGYYRSYGPPVYAYPPVVVVPPPAPAVIVSPGYAYPAPAYPAPAYVAPPVPMYGPPAVGYGVIGPRGRLRAGYVAPRFGVYIGR